MTWQIWALLSAAFAAATALLAKVGVQGVDSNLAMAIRSVVILLAAWSLAFVTHSADGIKSLAPRTWLFLALSGLATGASWACYFRALQLGEASKVAPVDKLSVPLVVVLAALFLHEKLDWKTALGAALITIGALVIAWPSPK